MDAVDLMCLFLALKGNPTQDVDRHANQLFKQRLHYLGVWRPYPLVMGDVRQCTPVRITFCQNEQLIWMWEQRIQEGCPIGHGQNYNKTAKSQLTFNFALNILETSQETWRQHERQTLARSLRSGGPKHG